MSFKPIIPKGSAPPLAPYSHGAKAGNVLYVSGMLSLDSQGHIVGIGDVKAQTRNILESIKLVVTEAGGSMSDIAFNQIFLKSLDDYAAVNEIYKEYFPQPSPARYCIQANLVKPEFVIEIASTAHIGN